MDLGELERRVREAAAEAVAPPAEGETKPFAFTSDLLGDAGWELLWEAVHVVRERAPETFVDFTPINLAFSVVEELESNSHASFDSLIAALRKRSAGHGRRVVCTALSNFSMDETAIRLGDDAALIRGDHDRHSESKDEDVVAGFELKKWLGASISRPLRVLESSGGQMLDTTRTAAILTVEDGLPELALARARAKTQYAIAMWVVLVPPEGRTLLPDVAVWTPQPALHLPQRHRLIPENPDPMSHSPVEEGGGVNEYKPYPCPAKDVLRLPFEAMEHTGRRGAQAVLSASLQHLAAARASRLQPSERVRGLMAAVECLGEHGKQSARNRFHRLAARHKTDAVPARNWDHARVRQAFDRIINARNIATHGADAALLDLGYPIAARRQLRHGKQALGVELALSSLNTDLPILTHVVGATLAATIRELASDNWSDKAFQGYFN